jgi:hypothetical protein
MPEYTVSLLLWIVPVVAMGAFLHRRKSLGSVQRTALVINLVIFAVIGCMLDLLFADRFFIFVNPDMTLRIPIRNIPIEEFLFYIFGFWFIVLFYAFNDEYFLRKYNKDDRHYIRYASRIKNLLVLFFRPWHLLILALVLIGLTLLKRWLNPAGALLPEYMVFLCIIAYIPFIFFWRLTRTFVNLRAFILVVVLTTLISIIWEVTLALPRGYWNYNHNYMLGLFIPFWHSLPVEAVTVWLFSSLIILCYEYSKIALHHRNAVRQRSHACVKTRIKQLNGT